MPPRMHVLFQIDVLISSIARYAVSQFTVLGNAF